MLLGCATHLLLHLATAQFVNLSFGSLSFNRFRCYHHVMCVLCPRCDVCYAGLNATSGPPLPYQPYNKTWPHFYHSRAWKLCHDTILLIYWFADETVNSWIWTVVFRCHCWQLIVSKMNRVRKTCIIYFDTTMSCQRPIYYSCDTRHNTIEKRNTVQQHSYMY